MPKPSPKLLFDEEWASLFIHWLVKERHIRSRYRELSVEELDRLSKKFVAKFRAIRPYPDITASRILDAATNNGWLIPSAGSTFTLRDDLVRR